MGMHRKSLWLANPYGRRIIMETNDCVNGECSWTGGGYGLEVVMDGECL